MAPQNDQEQPLYRPIPVQKLGSYNRRARLVTDRVLAQSGLTENSDDNGVAPLDVCAFQSSV